MGKKTFFALMLAGGLSACASIPIDFDDSDVGQIKGELLVFWVQSDKFVYYPAPENRLRYYLPKKLAKRLGQDFIEPGVMYTDGGSIPKPVQGFAGLSPWGYGPAYVVHDWMFIAHRCIRTGQENRLLRATPDQINLARRAEFKDSASVLAGIIASLVNAKAVMSGGISPNTIVSAVSSSVAERLWSQDDPAVCQRDTVSAADLRSIEAALGRSGRMTTMAAGSRAPASTQECIGGAAPVGVKLVTRQTY